MIRGFLVLLLVAFCGQSAWSQPNPSSWGAEQREYVLTGARIYLTPTRVLERGELHIKDGTIVAVGATVKSPPGVRRLDVEGKVIHAGFIDPYVTADRVGMKEEATATPTSGVHDRVHDDRRLAETLDLKQEALKSFRDLGYVAVAVAPKGGIFRGQAALYRTGRSANDAELLLDPSAYSTVGFEELGWSKLKGENYPLSLMGSVALIRQTFLDARWYNGPHAEAIQLPYLGTLRSLTGALAGKRRLLFEATDVLETVRFESLVRELSLKRAMIVLSGEEWMAMPWFLGARQADQDFIVPLSFPQDPKFEKGTKESQVTLAALQRWYYAPANPRYLAQAGVKFAFTTHGGGKLEEMPSRWRESVAAGLSKEQALAALTTEPARILGLTRLGTLEPGKSASFVVREGHLFEGLTKICEVWVEGDRYLDYEALTQVDPEPPKEVSVRDFVQSQNYTSLPKLFPEPYQPGTVFIKDATLWTQDTPEVIERGSMLVRNGKIAAVGPDLPAPGGVKVIDGRGMHLTPGIIDAHSHTAIDGDVNEPGANVTSMVRIKDVINPFDENIYLQLAAGVTSANLLHGSANAIGGQSITCKWRLGEKPEGMVLQGAPEGIKFALGENPKQSNWGDAHSTRYPQSRLGVVELIRGSFTSAANYRSLKRGGKNPRPDLKLEALVDVLEGRRLVHCHSYRQDEILALIRVAEEVGFKVNVFQHVLEGYKVADEMARHGAGASTFADWWAYKVEVDDAIPSNAALMQLKEVLVTVNSDSDDLARRLNTEAAKSMRYGNLSAVEALSLITRNAATQLGVLDQVGTLTPGKSADFVLWSDNPLSQNAVVLQTWIDGKRYFSSELESARVNSAELERSKYLSLLKAQDEEKK